jgi:hypothetical protein
MNQATAKIITGIIMLPAGALFVVASCACMAAWDPYRRVWRRRR